MANIIVSYWSANGQVMYDGIVQALKEQGNNVLCLNMYGFISFSKWGITYKISSIDTRYLNTLIKQFVPDLILSFNNVFPYSIIQELQCPVCLLDADLPTVGFWNRDELVQNKNRYVFLGFQSVSKDEYEKAFGEIDKYLYFPAATTMESKDIVKDINISFIGSSFLSLEWLVSNYNFVAQPLLFNEILEVYRAFHGKFCNTYDIFKSKYLTSNDDTHNKKIFDFFYYNISGMDRISYLDVLSDMELKIFGLDTWRELLFFNIGLAQCFDDKKVMTFEDNSNIYNRSKIAINISHQQAISCFSWRVMDIMASSACLLMEDKPDWRSLFEKYLSKDVMDVIIYKDRFDMREKAKRLLADETLRQKCVKELNNAIEQNGRWEIRFKELEKFLSIKLINTGNDGHVLIIKKEQPDIKQEQPDIKQETAITSCKKKKGLNLKKRVKLFAYLLLLAIWQIPILDLGIRRHKREKILHKIHKYWR